MPDELIAIPVSEYERLKRIERSVMAFLAQQQVYWQTMGNQTAQTLNDNVIKQQIQPLKQSIKF